MAISVGSVAVDVVPDMRKFTPELKAKTADISVDVGIEAQLDQFRAQIEEATRARTATVNVNADTALAESQIDAVARDRRASVGISGLSEVTSGVSALGLAVATLGPALIPVTAAVAGLGLALAGPVAAAGGGLTIGALIAGKAIADTNKQQKQITDLAKKVSAAKLAVSQATTDAGRKSALARETAAVQAYQAALAQLTPEQAKFIDAQARLKGAFASLTTTAGPIIFGPVIKGMDLLAEVLPKVKPLLRGVADGIDVLLTDLSKAASGPGFKAFISAFGAGARDAIIGFGRIFESVSKGLVSFFGAFAPLSRDFAKGLGAAASGFADWAKSLSSSKSFQGFLAYVRDVGPKVAAAFGHMFQALGKIGVVMAPLGGLVLGLVDGLSQMISTATPAKLAAVATGIGAIGVAVLFATGGVSGIIPAILGLGVGLTYAYEHSTKFRDVVGSIGRFFSDRLLPALEHAWKIVLPGIRKGFDNVKDSIQKNHGLFVVLGDVLKGLGNALLDKVLPAIATFYSVYLPILGKAIGGAIATVKVLADGFLTLAEFGLKAFKFLANGALGTFDLILTAADKGLSWIPGIDDKIHGARVAFDNFKDGTISALDGAIGKVRDLRLELDGLKPKSLEVRLKVTTQQLVANPSLGKPRILPEGAGARGAIINRPTVLLAGENYRPEALVPLDQTPGNRSLPGAGVGGPLINIESLTPANYSEFMREVQTRARQASLSGMR